MRYREKNDDFIKSYAYISSFLSLMQYNDFEDLLSDKFDNIKYMVKFNIRLSMCKSTNEFWVLIKKYSLLHKKIKKIKKIIPKKNNKKNK